jgi:hypothetical protein
MILIFKTFFLIVQTMIQKDKNRFIIVKMQFLKDKNRH